MKLPKNRSEEASVAPSAEFSYRHLHYFWVVGHEGGFTRAADRLGMAVQTVSAQVRELERALGQQLLRPAGRGVALTTAGEAAWRHADQIFQLGGQLADVVRQAGADPVMRLAVGIPDGLPKLVAHQFLRPVLQVPGLRLVCHEDRPEELLASLALHRLDMVVGDRPADPQSNLRLFSHPLGRSAVAWYATPALARRARRGFPQALANVPLLLPTSHASVRAGLDRWLERHGVRPTVAGEFDDSALLKTFGAEGLGAFPAVTAVEADLRERYGVQRLGLADGVVAHWYAIAAERRIQHPLVRQVLAAAAAADAARAADGTEGPR